MMNRSFSCLQVICVMLVHTFACFSVASLPEDREQPIYISSDRAHWRGEQNVTVYEGNVELTQGTLKIVADKITVYHDAEEISTIIAIGQPVNYRQQLNIEQDDVIATANTITYELLKEHILLRGDASINQLRHPLVWRHLD